MSLNGIAAWLTSVGSAAKHELSSVDQASVIAVFDRSFYLKTGDGLVCIGLADIGRGPMNAILAARYKRLPFKVAAGECARVIKQQVIFDANRMLDASKACEFPSVSPVTLPETHTLVQNRVTLRNLQRTPVVGFYWLVTDTRLCGNEPTVQSALKRATDKSLTALARWLRLALSDSCKRYNKKRYNNFDGRIAMGLSGAGPGLTPSGDDVLSGVMLALVRLQRTDLVMSMWQQIQPLLVHTTNAISAAHMAQSSKGRTSEAMDALLDLVFYAEEIDTELMTVALNKLGSTSGWDTLGGVAMVIDAWQCSLNTTQRTLTTC